LFNMAAQHPAQRNVQHWTFHLLFHCRGTFLLKCTSIHHLHCPYRPAPAIPDCPESAASVQSRLCRQSETSLRRPDGLDPICGGHLFDQAVRLSRSIPLLGQGNSCREFALVHHPKQVAGEHDLASAPELPLHKVHRYRIGIW
jgi:hypothetical protein